MAEASVHQLTAAIDVWLLAALAMICGAMLLGRYLASRSRALHEVELPCVLVFRAATPAVPSVRVVYWSPEHGAQELLYGRDFRLVEGGQIAWRADALPFPQDARIYDGRIGLGGSV